MRKLGMLLSSSLLALAVLMPQATPAGAVATEVSPAAFGAPRVLDFNVETDGPVAGNAALFTEFGIESVAAVTAAPGPDGYGGGPPFYRALFHANAVGLFFASLPTTPWFDRSPTFTISFAQEQFLFGVALVDTLGPMRIRFRRNGAEVGALDFSTDRVSNYYFHSTLPFDEVVIDQPAQVDGWGIDNLTLDAPGGGDPRRVPNLPATGALLALSLITATVLRSRQGHLRSRLRRSGEISGTRD